MFKVFLGEVTDGKLARLPYIGYSILLIVVVIISALVFSSIFSTIAVEINSAGGVTIPILLTSVPPITIGLLWGFATLNITAKRIRHIGLPGWTSFFTYIIILFVLGFVLPDYILSIIPLATHLFLLLMPGKD